MTSEPKVVVAKTIDIIIPVYRGIDETRACIESVLATCKAYIKVPHEIVVINDAAPEVEIAAYLAKLGVEKQITLLTNPQNLGFVRSCNRALSLHADRDVVLLNSDTVVANDWLDRIHMCAYSAENIASVTPFSNNATLCSYPRAFVDNPIAASQTESLDALFANANAGLSVDIPTAVGFCMFMRREAIVAVGLFDDVAFGRGYGEENDWCCRAEELGWTHKLAADVFVWHRGGVSFGRDAVSQQAQARAVIEDRYPTYNETIQTFAERDPARPHRRAVDCLRLQTSARPKVLFITHHWGGGTEQHVRELVALTADDLEGLVLRPHGDHHVALTWAREGEAFAAFFDTEQDWHLLLDLLRGVFVERVHLHHVHGHSIKILDLASELRVPLDVTLHDYFPVTSRYHTAPGGTFVAQDGSAHAWGLDDIAWRARMMSFLMSASRVVAPTRDLAIRVNQYFPDLKMEVRGHPERVRYAQMSTIKVLILGGMTKDKGLDVVVACARDAKVRALPMTFKIIGHTADVVPQDPELPLFVHGSYGSGELARLVEIERADVFLFPAQIPESYSYTLSCAMAAGLPIVASKLGAFVERLGGYRAATLVEWNSAAAHWNDALLAAAHKAEVALAVTGDTSEVDTVYRQWYLQAFTLPSMSISKLATVAVPGSIYFDHHDPQHEVQLSLRTLYEVGVLSHHAPSRDQLGRRLGEIGAEHDKLQETIVRLRESLTIAQERLSDLKLELEAVHEAAREQIETLELEQQAAREAFTDIANSTTWRLTLPLRSVVLGARQVKSKLKRLAFRASRLPQQAAIANHILREEGPAALGRRVHAKLTRANAAPVAVSAHYVLEKAIESLSVPHAMSPQVSIIIPVYGQHLLTYTCLKSIVETCADQSIEVIVIDDCSPEPASVALRAVSGVEFIRNDTNLGFLRNCNKAAAQAKGAFLVLLNNDTIVTDGWLKSMLEVFTQHERVGLVGAKLIYPDGVLQEAGGIVWRDGSAWNVGRNEDALKPEYNYLREVDYCSGACLMIAHDFWNTLGGFDERFVPAYYEDTDLAFQVRAAGKRVFYQPRATIVHFEGRTSGTDLTSGVKQHQVANQKTFATKWGEVLRQHRQNGVQPQLERDRYAKKRVLVVDACMLTPDQDAGSLRMFEILGVLRELECKVTFLAQNREYREPYVAQIQALGVEVLYHPYVPAVEVFLETSMENFDVVVLSRATVACQYVDMARKLIKSRGLRTRLIFDTVDLHFVREERQADLTGGVVARAAASATRKRELSAMAQADVTLVVSPTERQLLASLIPSARVDIVSTIHVSMPGDKVFSQRDGVVFIGGFRHPPNLDAITWYVDNVLPILRAKQAGVITTIIGSNVPPTLQRLAAPDFVIAGFVPDVTPFYETARVSISPLRYGAGVKGKINLAMQYGVPVVATTVSVEGMYLQDKRDVLVADDPEAFADAVIRLHNDPLLWQRLRQGGLENIEEWFSRTRASEALKTVLMI
jgi:O-antigen biosynthesis protein